MGDHIGLFRWICFVFLLEIWFSAHQDNRGVCVLIEFRDPFVECILEWLFVGEREAHQEYISHGVTEGSQSLVVVLARSVPILNNIRSQYLPTKWPTWLACYQFQELRCSYRILLGCAALGKCLGSSYYSILIWNWLIPHDHARLSDITISNNDTLDLDFFRHDYNYKSINWYFRIMYHYLFQKCMEQTLFEISMFNQRSSEFFLLELLELFFWFWVIKL